MQVFWATLTTLSETKSSADYCRQSILLRIPLMNCFMTIYNILCILNKSNVACCQQRICMEHTHTHTQRESGIVCHQTLLGQWCECLFGFLKIKTPLQVSYFSFRDDHQLLQPWHDRTSLSDTILPTPSAAISSILLDLHLTLLYLSTPEVRSGCGGGGGLPLSPVRLCPIHPSLSSSAFIITLLPSSWGVTGVSGLTEMLCTCPASSQGTFAVWCCAGWQTATPDARGWWVGEGKKEGRPEEQREPSESVEGDLRWFLNRFSNEAETLKCIKSRPSSLNNAAAMFGLAEISFMI